MSTDTITRIKPQTDLATPGMFKVIYKNDNQTTVDFVVDSCVEYFNYTVEEGINIANKVHEIGSAVVAVLPHELAEQKGAEVTQAARGKGFPLVVQVKKD